MEAKLTIPKSEIDKFNKNLGKEMKRITDKASLILADETLKAHSQMRRTILVDTGRARNSTLFKFERQGSLLKEAVIGTYVNYAIYIERYKKYFKPAIKRARQNLFRRLNSIR
jgi:hypothetical protein